jgi:hypothetical protein
MMNTDFFVLLLGKEYRVHLEAAFSNFSINHRLRDSTALPGMRRSVAYKDDETGFR